jgi:hypothetical protein
MALSDDLILEDADVIWRNFAGREKPFNSEGDRNFCVNLDADLAMELREKGWNIKQHKVVEEGEEPRYYTQIVVKYGTRPPRAVVVNSKGRMQLSEEDISLLDWADIKQWDLVINPHKWEMNGKTGVKGYLKMAFVTLNENFLELKYADLDELNPTTTIPNSTVRDNDDLDEEAA